VEEKAHREAAEARVKSLKKKLQATKDGTETASKTSGAKATEVSAAAMQEGVDIQQTKSVDDQGEEMKAEVNIFSERREIPNKSPGSPTKHSDTATTNRADTQASSSDATLVGLVDGSPAVTPPRDVQTGAASNSTPVPSQRTAITPKKPTTPMGSGVGGPAVPEQSNLSSAGETSPANQIHGQVPSLPGRSSIQHVRQLSGSTIGSGSGGSGLGPALEQNINSLSIGSSSSKPDLLKHGSTTSVPFICRSAANEFDPLRPASMDHLPLADAPTTSTDAQMLHSVPMMMSMTVPFVGVAASANADGSVANFQSQPTMHPGNQPTLSDISLANSGSFQDYHQPMFLLPHNTNIHRFDQSQQPMMAIQQPILHHPQEAAGGVMQQQNPGWNQQQNTTYVLTQPAMMSVSGDGSASVPPNQQQTSGAGTAGHSSSPASDPFDEIVLRQQTNATAQNQDQRPK